MNSKNHRQNHNFQIVHFLAGACHTPDGAYALLCDLKEDREVAIRSYEAAQMKKKILVEEIEKRLTSFFPKVRQKAKAELAEIKATEEQEIACYKAAIKESSFISKCIEKVNPHRKFKDLPDDEANEAAQYEEWKLELINRAQNHLAANGQIPADHFATMRLHPAFKDEIFPAINNMIENRANLIESISNKKFDIPKLVGYDA